MLSILTDFACSKRGKWLVILFWVIAAALIVPLAPRLDEVVRNDQTDFLPSNSESTRAVKLVQNRYASDSSPAIIVYRNPDGLSDADYEQASELSDTLTGPDAPENIVSVVSLTTQPQARDSLVSEDGTTMTMIVSIRNDDEGNAFTDTVDYLRDRTGANANDNLQVKVSGPAGLLTDLVEVFGQIDGFLILVTGGLVLILLIIIYRSPIASIVPLFAVGWVFTLVGAVGALASNWFGLPVNGQSQGVMTVLLFGAGTDYSLFVFSRYREELEHVEDKHEAMRRAMRGVGEALASSAGTVFVAMLALLLATLKSNQSLGPLLAIAIGLMLLAALTLIPAILTVLGRITFWPFRPAYDPASASQDVEGEAHGVWSWVAARVQRRPLAVLVTTVLVFGSLAFGTLRLEQTYDSVASLPSGSESREGFELLRQSFPEGDLAPTELYVDLPAGSQVLNPDRLNDLDALTQMLASNPNIASVTSPSRPFGVRAPVGPQEVLAATASSTSADPQQQALAGQVQGMISTDAQVAKFSITLKQNPYSLMALNEIEGLRAFARNASAESGLGQADVLIGGPTATAHDTKVANDHDIVVVLPVILLAIGVILGLLLRSLIAPIYLLLTILISYFGTLGLSVVVFQDILHQAGTSPGTPFFLFVFLVALGVDYNIFLMARIREETSQHGLRTGTRRALGRTGGVITSAGIILAGTFGALMTLPLQELFQLGFAVAVGVLLDTFVVRTLMVPSIVMLLGRWNWWPSSFTGEQDPQPATTNRMSAERQAEAVSPSERD